MKNKYNLDDDFNLLSKDEYHIFADFDISCAFKLYNMMHLKH